MDENILNKKFETVFEKLDLVNSNLTDFKVKTTEEISKKPCGAHKARMDGFKARVNLITVLLVIIVGALATFAIAAAINQKGQITTIQSHNKGE